MNTQSIPQRILVVEDDQNTREALLRILEFEGFEVSTAADGAEALSIISVDSFDAIVLDRTMPYVDGLTVCSTLRSKGIETPVLFLTAMGETEEKVKGLEVGADDYLSKPFSMKELLARINALLRRSSLAEAQNKLSYEDVELNSEQRTVSRGGEELHLTKLEFDLLELFLVSRNIVLVRDDLYQKLWGYIPGPNSRSLEAHIKNLRHKLEAGGKSALIQTVRGVGYVLRTDK